LATSGADRPGDTVQLQAWQGEFGRAYTEHNVADWRRRLPAFRHMLEGLDLRRVLEVGCNWLLELNRDVRQKVLPETSNAANPSGD
jgi:hypothetical protein